MKAIGDHSLILVSMQAFIFLISASFLLSPTCETVAGKSGPASWGLQAFGVPFLRDRFRLRTDRILYLARLYQRTSNHPFTLHFTSGLASPADSDYQRHCVPGTCSLSGNVSWCVTEALNHLLSSNIQYKSTTPKMLTAYNPKKDCKLPIQNNKRR